MSFIFLLIVHGRQRDFLCVTVLTFRYDLRVHSGLSILPDCANMMLQRFLLTLLTLGVFIEISAFAVERH